MTEDEDTTTAEGGPEPETPAKPKRVVGRPFPPGNRANPGGRPKTTERLRASLARLGPTAVAELGRQLKGTSANRRLDAAIEVLNRILGRPAQAITGADGAPLIPGTGGPPTYSGLVGQLIERARQLQAAGQAPEANTPAPTENAPPGASGAATRTVPERPS